MPNSPKLNIEALLGHVPLFNSLQPEELARIAAGTREVNVAKGETLFRKGDPCVGFHLIVYGQIKLAFTSAQGNEKVVEILNQSQTFGEALMFMEKPYIVFAQALADTQLLHIGKEAIFEEIDHHPRLARKMIAGLSMRLHQLIQDVESYSLKSGRERIIGYLLREIPDTHSPNESVTITLSTSKGTIASRLNLTQEHFSRILHELSDEGMIRVEGRRIHISEPAKISRF